MDGLVAPEAFEIWSVRVRYSGRYAEYFGDRGMTVKLGYPWLTKLGVKVRLPSA